MSAAKVASDLKDLLSKMDREDCGDPPEAEGEPDDLQEEEFMDGVKGVMEANLDEKSRHGYRLNLRRLIVFLYQKSTKKTGAERYQILHNDVSKALDAVARGKCYIERLHKAAYEQVLKASSSFHPIHLDKLRVEVYIAHLCNLKDSIKTGEYLKSYGGHRSALTYLHAQYHDAGVRSPDNFVSELQTHQEQTGGGWQSYLATLTERGFVESNFETD